MGSHLAASCRRRTMTIAAATATTASTPTTPATTTPEIMAYEMLLPPMTVPTGADVLEIVAL